MRGLFSIGECVHDFSSNNRNGGKGLSLGVRVRVMGKRGLEIAIYVLVKGLSWGSFSQRRV